jgi:hypothetical protein
MRTNNSLQTITASLAALGLCTCITAQSLSIGWYGASFGGGTSTNAQYSIKGTVGQPATAASAGGRYAVQSGFWGLIAAIQTPGAPTLRIINTTTNAIVLVWPSSQTAFALEQTTDLKTSNWVPVGAPPTDDGTNTTVVITPAAGNRFFRLKWP